MKKHNSYEHGRREFHAGPDEYGAMGLSLVVVLAVSLALYVLVHRIHIRPQQIVELSIYAFCVAGAIVAVIWHLFSRKKRREEAWPYPIIHVPMLTHVKNVQQANEKNAIVLAYDLERKPWLWSDEIRRMQAVLLGMPGAGKTTALFNIMVQDLNRRFGSKDHPRRMPIIFFDGKADRDNLRLLLPAIAAAGRLHQLRILDMSRPDISARYNPLHVEEDSYHEHINFIFGSFGLEDDFFKGRQKTFFTDLVRVLINTGRRFNIYDTMVAAMDPVVLKQQIRIAEYRLQHLSGVPQQRRLNFEMSVRSLYQAFADREGVQKIQGLLDKLSGFLEEKLSVITGPYEDLLTLDQVIDEELILYVPLNTLEHGEAAIALGKILLHNFQMMIGKRYRNQWHGSDGSPMVSMILDEFAAFAYPGFADIIQKARGANAAMLFSLQSVEQLDRVSSGFRHDVLSAPNTIMCMRTRDKQTAEYFEEASSKVVRKRRSLTVQEVGILEERYESIGFGSETEVKETRSQDEHIKNLPKGQMEILQTDDRLGTLHRHLFVRPPFIPRLGCFEPRVYPYLGWPYSRSQGANLRFTNLFPNRKSHGSGEGGRS